jgi:hypothetical protein
MVIDDEPTPTQEDVGRAKSAPPGEVNPLTMEPLSFEAGSSEKGKVVTFLILVFSCDSYVFLLQNPEHRPEVRLLEYCQVPGMSFGREYLKALKYIALGKRSTEERPVSAPPIIPGMFLFLGFF